MPLALVTPSVMSSLARSFAVRRVRPVSAGAVGLVIVLPRVVL